MNDAAHDTELFARMVRVAVQTERSHNRSLLLALVEAYDKALADPKATIPTYLHAALEAARREANK
jgi:hypothetical protein